MAGAVPPNSETVMAYGSPTPSARTLVGNNSAFTTALMEVYPATKIQAAHISRKAVKGVFVAFRVVRIGIVQTVPAMPKKISRGLRPMRSEDRKSTRLNSSHDQI